MTSFDTNTESEQSHYLLVTGIDGSGKSTFLRGLGNELGYVAMEPTGTPEARSFKANTLEEPVTDAFIDERECLYMGLNHLFDEKVRESLDLKAKVASSGNSLVTLLSHNSMRAVALSKDTSVEDCVESWLGSGYLKPDAIVLVHAPAPVIFERISERQQAGDQNEKFWGFNSPFFLEQYQAAWRQALSILSNRCDIQCITLDSDMLQPHEMLATYQSVVFKDETTA